MKKFFFLMMVLMTTVNINAKDVEDDKEIPLIADLELGIGTRYKGLQQCNFSIDVGYTFFNLIYPYFRYESALMLYKHDGEKVYGNTSNIGGGLGVILYKDEDNDRLEFTTNMTTSVGGDYHNTAYYAGFRFRVDGHFVGLGYRYNKSRDCDWHDYSAFVFSIAF